MTYQTIGVKTLTPHIGAEIEGVDLSAPLSNEQFSEVYQAWLDWKVVVFRDQHLDREQHKQRLHEKPPLLDAQEHDLGSSWPPPFKKAFLSIGFWCASLKSSLPTQL